ncbi:MAG: glutamine-hydrolyzing GMP synthase [Mycoplasmoidaceae bacterium]
MKTVFSVIIIDFGSQYTNLIIKEVKKFGIVVNVCNENDYSKFLNENVKGIILSGGPQSVNGIKNISIFDKLFLSGVPIFGICYGLQLIAKYFGGIVATSSEREFGKAKIKKDNQCSLFDDINFDDQNNVWMSHSDNVKKIPEGFKVTAWSNDIVAAFSKNNIYGVQFHPEVNNTQMGEKLFFNFITKICKIKSNITFTNIIEEKVIQIRKEVKGNNVLLALSGGVDSLVASVLINKAIGKKLHCFFVDNGLNRMDEVLETISFLRKKYSMNIKIIDAKKLFLEKLKNIKSPEKKRKIIGKLFIDVFQNETNNDKKYQYLAQGTILSDVIESSFSSKASCMIKSHHNVGGLPTNMKMKVIEPLKDLLKHEVRNLGKELDIPEEFVYRQPVPGPGYAVRILGDVDQSKLDLIAKVDRIFVSQLKKWNLYYQTSQAFVVLLPVKSVGVMGDYRTYEGVIAIRSVETKDFMTAKFSHLPWEFLEEVSTKIINEVAGVNRVVYDITTKPPATIEWE